MHETTFDTAWVKGKDAIGERGRGIAEGCGLDGAQASLVAGAVLAACSSAYLRVLMAVACQNPEDQQVAEKGVGKDEDSSPPAHSMHTSSAAYHIDKTSKGHQKLCI